MAGQILYPYQATLQEVEHVLSVVNQLDQGIRQRKWLRASRDPATNDIVVEVEDYGKGLDRTFRSFIEWQVFLQYQHQKRKRTQRGIVLENLLSGPFSGTEYGVIMGSTGGIFCGGWYWKGRVTRETSLEEILGGNYGITPKKLVNNVAENVRQSCGTLIFARKGGMTLAMKTAFDLCAEQKKPVLTIMYPSNFTIRGFNNESIKKYSNPIANWLQSNRIVTLNVTGSTELSDDEEVAHFVREIVTDTLNQLGFY